MSEQDNQANSLQPGWLAGHSAEVSRRVESYNRWATGSGDVELASIRAELDAAQSENARLRKAVVIAALGAGMELPDHITSNETDAEGLTAFGRDETGEGWHSYTKAGESFVCAALAALATPAPETRADFDPFKVDPLLAQLVVNEDPALPTELETRAESRATLSSPPCSPGCPDCARGIPRDPETRAEIRAAERMRERCIKALCPLCAEGDPAVFRDGLGWRHTINDPSAPHIQWVHCGASQIRALSVERVGEVVE